MSKIILNIVCFLFSLVLNDFFPNDINDLPEVTETGVLVDDDTILKLPLQNLTAGLLQILSTKFKLSLTIIYLITINIHFFSVKKVALPYIIMSQVQSTCQFNMGFWEIRQKKQPNLVDEKITLKNRSMKLAIK